jgi:hypothetical protein
MKAPENWRLLILSLKITSAIIIVKIGVVLFNIPARPDEMPVSA